MNRGPTVCMWASHSVPPPVCIAPLHLIPSASGRRIAGCIWKLCLKEMEYTAEKMKGRRPLDTIYFGGGTPTSLPAEDIDAILCKAGAAV